MALVQVEPISDWARFSLTSTRLSLNSSHELYLVIKLDGGVHDGVEQQVHDLYRDQVIQEFSIWILRFKNEKEANEIENVLEKIRVVLP